MRCLPLITLAIVTCVSLAIGLRIGVEMGENFVYEREYKLNLHNLVQLVVEERTEKNPALFELIKAQTYVASQHVPDGWLREDMDHGPVNSDLLKGINPSKEPAMIDDSYESLLKRLKKNRTTTPRQ